MQQGSRSAAFEGSLGGQQKGSRRAAGQPEGSRRAAEGQPGGQPGRAAGQQENSKAAGGQSKKIPLRSRRINHHRNS